MYYVCQLYQSYNKSKSEQKLAGAPPCPLPPCGRSCMRASIALYLRNLRYKAIALVCSKWKPFRAGPIHLWVKLCLEPIPIFDSNISNAEKHVTPLWALNHYRLKWVQPVQPLANYFCLNLVADSTSLKSNFTHRDRRH